ncbi:TetR/AcrR family transcriptional regulator [Plantactinospora sp. WMMC1484]|uniref:TetR/AcrR family transcriptional regulator n=1 Tax=Plantactinospora sp. WMMC1484 TaxID=3404122 RepID=UPI003BF57C85
MSKGEATRQAVLAEATEIASRLGLGGLTIGTLAARMEMSKSGLFAHFRSKEALHLQVLDHARESFTAEVIRPALRAPRGEARIRALFENWYASIQVPGACLFVSASTEFDDQPGPIRENLVAAQRDLADVIAQIFRTGIAEGHFDSAADPERFAHDLHSVMLGAFHAERLLHDPRAETWTRQAFEALLDAARPKSD